MFNEVAELSIAQQLLGNSDLKTTLVYAKRHAGALTKVVHGYWDKRGALPPADCKNEKSSESVIAIDCNSAILNCN